MHVRSLLLTLALTASLTPALAPSTALAQMGPAPDCKGTMSIVRVSDILPGKMDTFMKAAAAQQAWYKKAGTADEIYVMRVLKQDPSTKAWSYSDTEALTNHTQPTMRKTPPHDADFDAFVALFKESSTIKSEYVACSAKM
jgi:hypothetical protein